MNKGTGDREVMWANAREMAMLLDMARSTFYEKVWPIIPAWAERRDGKRTLYHTAAVIRLYSDAQVIRANGGIPLACRDADASPEPDKE